MTSRSEVPIIPEVLRWALQETALHQRRTRLSRLFPSMPSRAASESPEKDAGRHEAVPYVLATAMAPEQPTHPRPRYCQRMGRYGQENVREHNPRHPPHYIRSISCHPEGPEVQYLAVRFHDNTESPNGQH